MTNKQKNIGLDVPTPEKQCNDKNCPFHGNIAVHGRKLTGIITSAKAAKTVTVEFSWKKRIQKYERFETRKTDIKAHAPPCFELKEGMTVTVMETRPLSKTKNFVVIQIVKDAI